MATKHIVQQGEHMAGIAEKYGFTSHEAIWNHPENRVLKELRGNPNVLREGDLIVIPKIEPQMVRVETGRVHRFVLRRSPLRLRLILRDANREPIAETPCQLHVEGEIYELMTDPYGAIEKEIPKTARHCRITIRDREIPVQVGHLDPVNVLSGQKARLNNLGYAAGNGDGIITPELRSAIEEFQCDQDLDVTGLCDDATQARLLETHGC